MHSDEKIDCVSDAQRLCGIALMGYTKNEGITGAASDNVETASSRVNIIEHWHAGFGSSSSSSKLECSSSLNLIFFSRA